MALAREHLLLLVRLLLHVLAPAHVLPDDVDGGGLEELRFDRAPAHDW